MNNYKYLMFIKIILKCLLCTNIFNGIMLGVKEKTTQLKLQELRIYIIYVCI